MSSTRSIVSVLATLVLASTSLSCASIMNGKDVETERLLSAAGFQMRLANTAAKADELASLPQRTVTTRTNDGKVFYVYADAKKCNCLYVGTQRAYDRYERLALAREISIRREEAAEDRADAAMELSSWGPWGPWWW